MARRLTTDREVDAFIHKVINDANHHAAEVTEIIMPLSQAVRKRLNLSQDKVEVFERNGNIGRTCWVVIKGNRWVFSYSYGSETIELRQGSTKGAVVFRFNNSTPLEALSAQVAAL